MAITTGKLGSLNNHYILSYFKLGQITIHQCFSGQGEVIAVMHETR